MAMRPKAKPLPKASVPKRGSRSGQPAPTKTPTYTPKRPR